MKGGFYLILLFLTACTTAAKQKNNRDPQNRPDLRTPDSSHGEGISVDVLINILED
jgi:hypothetical protein